MNTEDKQQLINRVCYWRVAKGIDNADKQALKIFEELGELSGAILRDDQPEIEDAIGDVAVTIIVWADISRKKVTPLAKMIYENLGEGVLMLWLHSSVAKMVNHEGVEPLVNSMIELESVAKKLGYDMWECLEKALLIIEARTGKTVDGTFIKQEDLV